MKAPLTCVALLGACTSSAPQGVTVLAASSLSDALLKVADAWGHAPVQFSFDASSRLAQQVRGGAPADALITADAPTMDGVAELVDGRRDLLGNRLVLIVPASAPDLSVDALPGVAHVALAGASVPAGRYARSALQDAGVWDRVADHVVTGDNVRTTLAWVARGEAEAGVVYATDAQDPAVRVTYTFPPTSHPPIVYPGAVIKGAAHAAEAAAFLDFCQGDVATAIFAAEGFIRP